MSASRNVSSYAIEILVKEKTELLRQEIAPDNCWIETCKVSGKNFVQAYYRSQIPVFRGKKRQYLGAVNSPAHKKAIEAIANRQRLYEINQQIEILESEMIG